MRSERSSLCKSSMTERPARNVGGSWERQILATDYHAPAGGIIVKVASPVYDASPTLLLTVCHY
jgi:hypothetical protein